MIWYNGLEEICRPDAPLCEHSWYKLGGPARWFFTPRDEPELAAVLSRCRSHNIPWRILGHGANLLVRDEGVDGAVIHLQGAAFEAIDWDDGMVRAAAGADFTKLVRKSCSLGWAGLEVLAGIPGTLGGIIRMNAGGRFGEICQVVRDVRLIDADGQLVTRPAAEVGFRYRHTDLAGCVIVGATLALQSGDREALTNRYREIWNAKYATQPAVSERSCGCIFKNPPGQSAGRLLDQSGLKGQRVGAAEISPKHANFIVAHEGARARDVLDLIALAKDRVWNACGIELQTEVEIW